MCCSLQGVYNIVWFLPRLDGYHCQPVFTKPGGGSTVARSRGYSSANSSKNSAIYRILGQKYGQKPISLNLILKSVKNVLISLQNEKTIFHYICIAINFFKTKFFPLPFSKLAEFSAIWQQWAGGGGEGVGGGRSPGTAGVMALIHCHRLIRS